MQFARIVFPTRFMDSEVDNVIDEFINIEYMSDNNGLYEINDNETRRGEFEELEKILVEKKIPFDRYSEGDLEMHPTIRFYRPDINYDELIVTDKDWKGVISTKEVYNLIKRYTDKKCSVYDLVVLLAELVKERDPLLTNRINPIEYYVEEDVDE